MEEQLFQIRQETLIELRRLVEEIRSGRDPHELLKRIGDLERELVEVKRSKRYGLVFEDKPEEFEARARNALPLLKEVKDLAIEDPDLTKPANLIIEGDNYHALSCLQFTHSQAIDVIYIDPPYNTGNKDFVYNDRFVDKEDAYRHSKWLSFMKKRLLLARKLLKDT